MSEGEREGGTKETGSLISKKTCSSNSKSDDSSSTDQLAQTRTHSFRL